VTPANAVRLAEQTRRSQEGIQRLASDAWAVAPRRGWWPCSNESRVATRSGLHNGLPISVAFYMCIYIYIYIYMCVYVWVYGCMCIYVCVYSPKAGTAPTPTFATPRESDRGGATYSERLGGPSIGRLFANRSVYSELNYTGALPDDRSRLEAPYAHATSDMFSSGRRRRCTAEIYSGDVCVCMYM